MAGPTPAVSVTGGAASAPGAGAVEGTAGIFVNGSHVKDVPFFLEGATVGSEGVGLNPGIVTPKLPPKLNLLPKTGEKDLKEPEVCYDYLSVSYQALVRLSQRKPEMLETVRRLSQTFAGLQTPEQFQERAGALSAQIQNQLNAQFKQLGRTPNCEEWVGVAFAAALPAIALEYYVTGGQPNPSTSNSVTVEIPHGKSQIARVPYTRGQTAARVLLGIALAGAGAGAIYAGTKIGSLGGNCTPSGANDRSCEVKSYVPIGLGVAGGISGLAIALDPLIKGGRNMRVIRTLNLDTGEVKEEHKNPN